MTFSQKILLILTSSSGGYRLLRKLHSLDPAYAQDKLSDATFRITLSRLKKYGFVENNGGVWSITRKGSASLKELGLRPIKRHTSYRSGLSKKPKSLIISFDIPEVHRRKRNWLRIELVNLGFSQLHKSVWFGPSPLPLDFVSFLKEFSLFPYMKFFSAREEEVV